MKTAEVVDSHFCVMTQFLTPSAVIISISSWHLIFFHINVIRVGIDKNQCDLSFDIFFTVLLKESKLVSFRVCQFDIFLRALNSILELPTFKFLNYPCFT